MIGKIIIANAFNKNIIVMAVNKSLGLALMIGAIATIAVPPQIAAPEAISRVNFLSRPINLPI